MSDSTTRRAEQIREQTGMAWEHACRIAERERDIRAANPGLFADPAACPHGEAMGECLPCQTGDDFLSIPETGLRADR